MSAQLGDDTSLMDLLTRGELDVIVTSSSAPRRGLALTEVGTKRFVLVAAPTLQPSARRPSIGALGEWLDWVPWAGYRHELPLTRRFWQPAR